MQYLQIYEREVMLVHLESVEAYIRIYEIRQRQQLHMG